MPHARSFNPFTFLVTLAFVGLAAAFITPAPSPDRGRNACLWDYDTLRYEAQGMPSTIAAITGRFDRFPPLYYEMRLERVAGELETEPTRLDLYDDAGVACDRLGRHDEAIEWMARKREQLDRAPDAEHEYRYLANLGTFHAHRWLAGGADREDLSDIETAADLIGRAIELNPDAHFGRERYQLMAIEWVRDSIDPDRSPPGEIEGKLHTLFDTDPQLMGIAALHGSDERLRPRGYGDTVEGLTGLITMGAAWESIDILAALQIALLDQGDAHVAYLVEQRVDTLEARGLRSLHPAQDDLVGAMLNRAEYQIDVAKQTEMDQYLLDARQEAGAWRDSQHAYLLDRLVAGEHPDTHPEFWVDWEYAATPPVLPGTLTPMGRISTGQIVVALLAILGGLAGAIVVLFLTIQRFVR